MLVSKSVFKLIFVLSNYQTLTTICDPLCKTRVLRDDMLITFKEAFNVEILKIFSQHDFVFLDLLASIALILPYFIHRNNIFLS